jgi:hypothetical protein
MYQTLVRPVVTYNNKNDACSRRYLPKTKRNISTGWVDHKRTQNEIPKMYEEAA